MNKERDYPYFLLWSGLPMIRLSERHWPAHHLNGKKIIFYDFHAYFTETIFISQEKFVSMMHNEGCAHLLKEYGIGDYESQTHLK